MPENIRVLFVDDDPTLRLIWSAILAGEPSEHRFHCSGSIKAYYWRNI